MRQYIIYFSRPVEIIEHVPFLNHGVHDTVEIRHEHTSYITDSFEKANQVIMDHPDDFKVGVVQDVFADGTTSFVRKIKIPY